MNDLSVTDQIISVNLKEYEHLRYEINNRTRLSGHIVSLQLTALGAGLAIIDKYPDIVIALAAVSSFLWLLWLDHTSQIYKIAAYISLKLAYRLQRISPEVMGWETFLRSIDQGGFATEVVLFGKKVNERFLWLHTNEIAKYVALLFGVSPGLLIAGFLLSHYVQFKHIADVLSVRGGLLGVAIVLWLYSLSCYYYFVKMRTLIDKAILSHGQEEDVLDGKKSNISPS